MATANVAHTAHLVFRGTTLNVQSWSWGFWVFYGQTGYTPSADEVASTLTSSAEDHAWQDTLLADVVTYMAASQRFTQLDVLAYGEDPSQPSIASRSLQNVGTQGSMNCPPECAVVCSLRSGLSGRSGRGRFYLPLNGIECTSAGQIPSATAADLASKVAAALSSINGITHSDISGTWQATAAVISRTHGLHNTIKQVVVDERFDSQRRREDKLVGASHIASVTNP